MRPVISCFSETGSRNINPLVLIPSSLARVMHAGRFAKGSSGNPHGRPRGIPNPERRVPDLVARPLSARALSDLLDRKPDLLRLLATQILPPPRAIGASAGPDRVVVSLSARATSARFGWRAEGEFGRMLARRI
jgi:hypothetical protein